MIALLKAILFTLGIVYIHVQFVEHEVLYIRYYHYHLETITVEF